MIENNEKSHRSGTWDKAGAVLLAAVIGLWLVAYVVVAARAWLGMR